MNDILDLIARILLATLFFFEAADSIIYYQLTLDKMIAYGLSWYPDVFLVGASVLLIVGGVMMLIGYRVRLAGFLFLLYWIPLTLIIHAWWTMEPGELRRTQSSLFVKNMAIVAAVLFILAKGSGRYSVRRLLDRRKIKS